MDAFIIVATTGRATETRYLIDYIAAQSQQPRHLIIVGAEMGDVSGLSDHPWMALGKCDILISPTVGLTSQRNFGLDHLKQGGHFSDSTTRFFCAFFDDDFRPAPDWIERAAQRLERDDVVGLTGVVLTDGVQIGGLKEEEAQQLIAGVLPSRPHWTNFPYERDAGSAYGCNMAFADVVVRDTRFDEALALYGWQEDRDYTGLARKYGRVIYFPGCRGVHLGVSSGGRTCGVKFGYSQIANPIHLMKKGTTNLRTGLKFIGYGVGANLIRSVRPHPRVDYRGRLKGNMLAVLDLICLRLDPRRVLSL